MKTVKKQRWNSSSSNGVLSLCDAYRRWWRTRQVRPAYRAAGLLPRCKWFYLHLSSACSVSQSSHKMVSLKKITGIPGVNENQTAWRKMKGLKSLSLTTRMAIASWKCLRSTIQHLSTPAGLLYFLSFIRLKVPIPRSIILPWNTTMSRPEGPSQPQTRTRHCAPETRMRPKSVSHFQFSRILLMWCMDKIHKIA